MNKEIEEIIEYFRNDIKWIEEELKNPHYLGYYITIRDKEYEYLKQLLDYITNLQEENELLKNRIDKAIDVLDNSSHYLKICVDNDLTPMQLASKILRGEE